MWKGRVGAGWQRTHQARSRQGRVLETEQLCTMPLRVGPLSIFVVYFVIVKVYAIVMSCRSVHAFSWKPSFVRFGLQARTAKVTQTQIGMLGVRGGPASRPCRPHSEVHMVKSGVMVLESTCK